MLLDKNYFFKLSNKKEAKQARKFFWKLTYCLFPVISFLAFLVLAFQKHNNKTSKLTSTKAILPLLNLSFIFK